MNEEEKEGRREKGREKMSLGEGDMSYFFFLSRNIQPTVPRIRLLNHVSGAPVPY